MLPYFFPDKLPVIAFAGILFTFAATCIFISKFAGFLPKDQGREFAVDGKKSADREERALSLYWYLRCAHFCFPISALSSAFT